MTTSSTRKVARNSVFMYMRMIFLMLIGFYTSRLLLQLIGVEDYGIYSVVGSVTATFAALKSLFTESIQRFLNYQKGKDSLEGQRDVYTISIYIHAILAIAFFIIIEIIGCRVVTTRIVLPADKLPVALFVFHSSVVSVILSILSIPFDSVVIANERMDVYAYFSIFDGLFKLLVLLLLPYLNVAYLEAYALALIVNPLVYLILSMWFTRRFKECCLQKKINRGLLREIASLSSWNFFGNIFFSLLHEGINFILNAFGGLAYNAARGISYQIRGIVCQVSNNLFIAARPMLMQSAALERKDKLINNIITFSRASFFLMLLTVAPIITFCPSLLSLWLGKVPDYACIFTQVVLVAVLIRSLHEPLNILYMSFAKIKRMMLIEVLIMLSTLFVVYFCLSEGLPILSAFIILAIMEFIIIMGLYINSIFEIQLPAISYLKNVLLPFMFLTLINGLSSIVVSFLVPSSSIVIVLIAAVVYEIYVAATIYLFLNKQEKVFAKKALDRILVQKHCSTKHD